MGVQVELKTTVNDGLVVVAEASFHVDPDTRELGALEWLLFTNAMGQDVSWLTVDSESMARVERECRLALEQQKALDEEHKAELMAENLRWDEYPLP